MGRRYFGHSFLSNAEGKRERELNKTSCQEAGPCVMSVIMGPLCRTQVTVCLSSAHKEIQAPPVKALHGRL